MSWFHSDRGPQEPPGSANMTRPPSRTRFVLLLLSCPSKHCRVFASTGLCLNSPGCVPSPHHPNSSCTRLTSRCASAAAPSTRRKHCWVSLCHTNSERDRKAKKKKKIFIQTAAFAFGFRGRIRAAAHFVCAVCCQMTDT